MMRGPRHIPRSPIAFSDLPFCLCKTSRRRSLNLSEPLSWRASAAFTSAPTSTGKIFQSPGSSPRLSICLPHAGGALLSLIGRMDRGYKITEECRQMKHKPSAYLKRFTYDTISHDPGTLLYLIRLVGAERVMIGSDYCFAIGYV